MNKLYMVWKAPDDKHVIFLWRKIAGNEYKLQQCNNIERSFRSLGSYAIFSEESDRQGVILETDDYEEAVISYSINCI